MSALPALSIRIREAARTTLAIVIIYAMGSWMGWEHGSWAAGSQHEVQRFDRAQGPEPGVGGGVLALVIIAPFPQDHRAYIMATSLAFAANGPAVLHGLRSSP